MADIDILKQVQDLQNQIKNMEQEYNKAEAEYQVKLEQRNNILSQIAEIISKQTNKPITPEQITNDMLNKYMQSLQQQIQQELNTVQQAINEYNSNINTIDSLSKEEQQIQATPMGYTTQVNTPQPQQNLDFSFLNT